MEYYKLSNGSITNSYELYVEDYSNQQLSEQEQLKIDDLLFEFGYN